MDHTYLYKYIDLYSFTYIYLYSVVWILKYELLYEALAYNQEPCNGIIVLVRYRTAHFYVNMFQTTKKKQQTFCEQ